jgi:fructokinase
MRIGIDWGGTKIEIIALDDAGNTLHRERVPTPRDDYDGCIHTVTELVRCVEAKTGQTGTVGFGIPGSIARATGLVRNANSVWMNGKPLLKDLQDALVRDVRIHNDANCFAVSEAVDGAGKGNRIVIGIIIGTGCGSGIAIDGMVHEGRGGIAGEIGHMPLAPLFEDELPAHLCWCGRTACLETYVSGPAFEKDYDRRIGQTSGLRSAEILKLQAPESNATYSAYISLLARGLAVVVNVLDPDIIVLGGGMSNIEALYGDLPDAIAPFAFIEHFDTPIVKAHHGDSSGVRGAAWLW